MKLYEVIEKNEWGDLTERGTTSNLLECPILTPVLSRSVCQVALVFRNEDSEFQPKEHTKRQTTAKVKKRQNARRELRAQLYWRRVLQMPVLSSLENSRRGLLNTEDSKQLRSRSISNEISRAFCKMSEMYVSSSKNAFSAAICVVQHHHIHFQISEEKSF